METLDKVMQTLKKYKYTLLVTAAVVLGAVVLLQC